jgi:hypothetical protein
MIELAPGPVARLGSRRALLGAAGTILDGDCWRYRSWTRGASRVMAEGRRAGVVGASSRLWSRYQASRDYNVMPIRPSSTVTLERRLSGSRRSRPGPEPTGDLAP